MNLGDYLFIEIPADSRAPRILRRHEKLFQYTIIVIIFIVIVIAVRLRSKTVQATVVAAANPFTIIVWKKKQKSDNYPA